MLNSAAACPLEPGRADVAAPRSSSRTSSSVVCVKSQYDSPTAPKGDGVVAQITSSTSASSSMQVGAAAGDGPHGQLLVAGNAELAYEVDVQGRAQGSRDLVGDGHTSPREGEDHHVVAPSVALEQTGEHPARLPPVPEPHLGHERAS